MRRYATGGRPEEFREEQRLDHFEICQVRHVIAAKIQQADVRLDQLFHVVGFLEVVVEQVLEQDGLSVGQRERETVGRFDGQLGPLTPQEAEVVIGETGGVEVMRISQREGVDDLL